jgi:hypothetical protein
VNQVQASAAQRVLANGTHQASVELFPCGPGKQGAPLERYSPLRFLTASGQAVTVRVTHVDTGVKPEEPTLDIPVCMTLEWPAKPVGATAKVTRVTVVATAKHPAWTVDLPMTLGGTSGVRQGFWSANSGSCLGVG